MRLDRPDGDWPWMRTDKKVIVTNERKNSTVIIVTRKPHIVFNKVAVPLASAENAILEQIEQNPDGITQQFMREALPDYTPGTLKVKLSHLRNKMKKNFGMDLLTGQAGAKATPGRMPPQSLTYIRKSQLKS